MSKKTRLISKELKNAVWVKSFRDQSDGFCYICSNPLTIDKYQVGFIISLKNGGEIDKDNLQPVCKKCNLGMLYTHLNMEDYRKKLKNDLKKKEKLCKDNSIIKSEVKSEKMIDNDDTKFIRNLCLIREDEDIKIINDISQNYINELRFIISQLIDPNSTYYISLNKEKILTHKYILRVYYETCDWDGSFATVHLTNIIKFGKIVK